MQIEARQHEAWLQTRSALVRECVQLDVRCDGDSRRFITWIRTGICIGAQLG